MVEDLGVAALQLPRGEEERPVDVGAELGQVGFDDAGAGERRLGQVLLPPDDRRSALGRDPVGQERLGLALGVELPEPVLVLAVDVVELRTAFGVEQVRDDAHDPGRVDHVDDGLPVLGRDPNGGVLPGRGRAPDQERQVEAATLHLLRDAFHLAERRRDEARTPDDVASLGGGGVQEHVGRDHHAEVDHLVVVAAEHHAHDVLADVVHVALDRAQDHLALRAYPVGTEPELLLLHVRLEVRDGAFHRPGALHHLRQEHLPGAEQITDDLHPGHQRPLDHIERAIVALPCLLRVLLDELVDAVHERVLEALFDRGLAPREIELLLHGAAPDVLGERHHALGRVRPPVEDDVLDVLEQIGGDVLVERDLTRVHDRHVEAGGDRVVQERRMDRLPDGVVAAEAEREVRDATGHLHAGQPVLEQRRGLDERLAVGVVLLDPGRDREDAGVDDDVLGHEAGAVDQQPDRTLEDLQLAFDGVGLPLLVERHHHDRRPVALDPPRLLEEVLLALLQADRVHDALALEAFQTRLEDVPLGRIDHHGHAGDLGLGGDQVQERGHGLHAVEQVGVHVHVEHVRAAADLVGRDLYGGLVVARLDQLAEPRRARDVLAFADHHEAGVRRDRERLEPAQRGHAPRRRHLAGREPRHRRRDRSNVFVGGPAAAPEDVGEAALGELTQVLGGRLGALVVAAERVREPGVRVTGRVDGRDACERLEVRAHLGRAERAVDADGERLRMRDREPERIDRLTRQRSAAPVGDRDRDHERHVRGDVARGRDRRLGVQRVEDRLDQEQVGAAVDERPDLLGVRLGHPVERDRAVGGLVHARRE